MLRKCSIGPYAEVMGNLRARIVGQEMHLISKLMIRLTAQKVGRDEFGNQYFEKRKARRGQRKRRYVLYKGHVEASKVPPDWHGWLHYTEEQPPPETGYAVHDWQQGHLPNLTGTKYAYRPPGHVLKGGRRNKATGDYEAWTP